MKQFIIDVEDENLIQILNMYSNAQLNENIPRILIENIDDLLEPVKDKVKENYNLYSNLNKKFKK